jgi:hypothetical protein
VLNFVTVIIMPLACGLLTHPVVDSCASSGSNVQQAVSPAPGEQTFVLTNRVPFHISNMAAGCSYTEGEWTNALGHKLHTVQYTPAEGEPVVAIIVFHHGALELKGRNGHKHQQVGQPSNLAMPGLRLTATAGLGEHIARYRDGALCGVCIGLCRSWCLACMRMQARCKPAHPSQYSASCLRWALRCTRTTRMDTARASPRSSTCVPTSMTSETWCGLFRPYQQSCTESRLHSNP